MIATDLDGTLLRRNRSVSPRTREAIAQARAAGMLVVIATARPPRTARLFAEAAGIAGIAICSNGAVTYDLDLRQLLEHRALDPEPAREVIACLRARVTGVCFAAIHGERFTAELAYAALARLEDHGLGQEEMAISAAELFFEAPMTKLIARHPERLPVDLLATLRSLDLRGFEADLSGAPFVEIVASGVSKGRALAELCASLGIAAEDVVAFGDAPNDVSMLRWAGRGIAVANAHPEALEAADETTAANEDDGVALVIERLLDRAC